MSARVPTHGQYDRLRMVAAGVVTAPLCGRWASLREQGWTRDVRGAYPVGIAYLSPQQITPKGLRALADAMERYEGEGGRP